MGLYPLQTWSTGMNAPESSGVDCDDYAGSSRVVEPFSGKSNICANKVRTSHSFLVQNRELSIASTSFAEGPPHYIRVIPPLQATVLISFSCLETLLSSGLSRPFM